MRWEREGKERGRDITIRNCLALGITIIIIIYFLVYLFVYLLCLFILLYCSVVAFLCHKWQVISVQLHQCIIMYFIMLLSTDVTFVQLHRNSKHESITMAQH